MTRLGLTASSEGRLGTFSGPATTVTFMIIFYVGYCYSRYTQQFSDVQDIMQVSPGDLGGDAFYVFISSTTGHGDMPDSTIDFVKSVNDTSPDLSALNFAIFGLGDQGYADTFNMGSEKLANLLTGAGATQIGTRGLFDASTGDMPEDIAIPWLEDILANMPALAEAV